MKRLNINLILISLILIFSLVSCSNLFGEKEKPVTTEDGYVIKGTIYLGSKTGAAPSFTGKNGRAATYSFEQEAENSSFTVYADYLDYAEHDYPNGSKDNFVQAVFDYGRHAWTYSINLSVKGKYQIRAERRVLGTEVWTSEPVEINVTSNTIKNVPDILMKPKLDNTANAIGRTALRFKDETSDQKIKMVVVHAPKTEDTSSYADYRTTSKEGQGLVMTGIDLPTGSYEVTIKFYDVITDIPENVEELYSTKETLNFLAGFTTDTWYGDSENYKVDEAGSYFAITDKLLNSYSNSGELEHPTVLWSDSETNLQIFGNIKNRQSISNPIADNVYSFCFGGGYVWVLNKVYDDDDADKFIYTLQGYKASYGKYFPDPEMLFELNYFDISKGLAYYENAIYFAYNDYNDSSSEATVKGWHFARLDLSDKTIKKTEAFGFDSPLCPAWERISTGMVLTSSYIYYIVYDCDNGGAPNGEYYIYRSPYTYANDTGVYELNVIVDDDDENFKKWSINSSDLQHSLDATSPQKYYKTFGYEDESSENKSKYFRLGDLQIIHDEALNEDFLYVLVYVIGLPKYYEKKSEDSYLRIGGRSGGVLMFDTDLNPLQWGVAGAINPYLLGCYSVNPEPLYIEKWQGYTKYYEHPDATEDEVIIQPPLNREHEFFFGPRRFIAIKPDQLVIADDGAHIEGDQEADAVKERRNRVVTVNLTNKSLSVVDVNVTFSSSFSVTGGTFIAE